jgi:hypothetical protein
MMKGLKAGISFAGLWLYGALTLLVCNGDKPVWLDLVTMVWSFWTLSLLTLGLFELLNKLNKHLEGGGSQ